MQPWLVRLDPLFPNRFDLFVDTGRLTPVVDPQARQTMLSQGAFLESVRVAGDELGLPVAIALFPDGAYSETQLGRSMRALPVARVAIGTAAGTVVDAGQVSAPAATRIQTAQDFEALYRSDTNRAPYADNELSRQQHTELAGVAAGTVVDLRLHTSAADRETLGALALRGTTVESALPAASAETAAVLRVNEYQKNARPWGFSVEGQGTSGLRKYLLQGALTLAPQLDGSVPEAARQIASTREAVAHTPAYAVLSTPGNDRASQVEAGMVYRRFELRARSLGLVVQPLSQILEEYPAMSTEYRAVHSGFAADGHTIQMLLRVGQPTVEFPPTMRRAVEDILA
jgi:hypothetical protein